MSFRPRRLSFRRAGRLLAVTLALTLAWAPTQAQLEASGNAEAELLNSERIEQTFGSYGIDVVYSDSLLRVSNLYSRHDGQKITRTLAIVTFTERADPAFADVHAEILAGGSIGASFTGAGWSVVKTRHRYIDFALDAAFAAPMRVAAGTPAAAHAYLLSIERDGAQFDYAMIVEIHHPDYLDGSALVTIYGPPAEDALMPGTMRRLMLAGVEQLEGAGLALSE